MRLDVSSEKQLSTFCKESFEIVCFFALVFICLINSWTKINILSLGANIVISSHYGQLYHSLLLSQLAPIIANSYHDQLSSWPAPLIYGLHKISLLPSNYSLPLTFFEIFDAFCLIYFIFSLKHFTKKINKNLSFHQDMFIVMSCNQLE